MALTPPQARSFYDRAGRWQDAQRFYEDPATRRLIAHAALAEAGVVVELGCGTGRLARRLLAEQLPARASYLALDHSAVMARIAAGRLGPWASRALVGLCDVTAGVPVAAGSADRVVSAYLLDLLDDGAIDTVLGEAHRMLRPGGRLCVAGLTDGRRGVSRRVSAGWTRVWRWRPGLVGGCRPVRIAERLDASAWRLLHGEVVTAWGIASEVVVASPRPPQG